MCKSYNVDWDQVLKWNILYFMKKFNFLEHKTKEELLKQQQSQLYKR